MFLATTQYVLLYVSRLRNCMRCTVKKVQVKNFDALASEVIQVVLNFALVQVHQEVSVLQLFWSTTATKNALTRYYNLIEVYNSVHAAITTWHNLWK